MIFERIVHKANDIVIVAEIAQEDGRFRIVYTNEAFTRVFGYTAEEALGQSPRMLQGPDTCAATVQEISQAIHSGANARRRLLNYSKSGERVWVEVNIVPLPNQEGESAHFAAIERDVTADVEREGALSDLALKDPLTLVGNRRYFQQALDRELTQARLSGDPLAFAILDLDRFKSVNDNFGHDAGDRVLTTFAAVLQRHLRGCDHVARIGGEEFAVLLPGAAPENALMIVERLCAGIRAKPIKVNDSQTIPVTCSAGLTSFTPERDDSATLLKRADQALYMAKNGGRDRVVELR